MGISVNIRQAYSEVSEFLTLIDENQKNKIPQNIIEIFENEKDKSYIKNINPNLPIKTQELKEETLAIIAWLNLKYWCEDEEERKELEEIYDKNEKIYENMLKVEFNAEEIFGRKIKSFEKEKQEQKNIVKYKEFTIKKLIFKILKIFRLK